MKLSSFQGDLLNLIKLDADKPVPEIARTLRTSERQVRYHIDRLRQTELIVRAPFINIYPLGLRYVNMYFSVASSRAQTTDHLIAGLIAHKKVSWVSELGGDFHFGVAFLVRGIEEVPAIISQVAGKLSADIFGKEFTTHLRLRMYPLKFLSTKRFTFPEFGYGHSRAAKTPSEEATLDLLDHDILRTIIAKPMLSQRDIARSLGKSPATIDYRIARLRTSGVLVGFWHRANFEALGLQPFKILVFSRTMDASFGAKLEGFCRQHARIDSFIECIGAWDFEIGLVVESAGEVGRITREINHLFGDQIHTTKIIPLLNTLKFNQLPEV